MKCIKYVYKNKKLSLSSFSEPIRVSLDTWRSETNSISLAENFLVTAELVQSTSGRHKAGTSNQFIVTVQEVQGALLGFLPIGRKLFRGQLEDFRKSPRLV